MCLADLLLGLAARTVGLLTFYFSLAAVFQLTTHLLRAHILLRLFVKFLLAVK